MFDFLLILVFPKPHICTNHGEKKKYFIRGSWETDSDLHKRSLSGNIFQEAELGMGAVGRGCSSNKELNPTGS